MVDVSASSSFQRHTKSDPFGVSFLQTATGLTAIEGETTGMGDMGDGTTAGTGIGDRKTTDAVVRTKVSRRVLVQNETRPLRLAHRTIDPCPHHPHPLRTPTATVLGA